MTVRIYRNTDPGAPALRGNAPGDLLNVLNKCLVDGYGSSLPAGWSRPYVSGNVAAFKQGPGGNDMYLRVDDSLVGTTRRHARVTGYESMSGLDTGGGPFPTPTQVAGGGYWFVQWGGTSAAADARTWTVIADETFFYLSIDTYPGYNLASFYYSQFYYFGDFEAYGPSDVFGTVLACGVNSSDDTASANEGALTYSSNLASNNSRLFAARRWDQLFGSTNVNLNSDSAKGSSSIIGGGSLTYPNGPDGRLYMAPVWVGDGNVPSNVSLRGHLPGLWNPLHAQPLGRGDTFVGQGAFAGKTFWTWRQAASCWAVETSDTWRG